MMKLRYATLLNRKLVNNNAGCRNLFDMAQIKLITHWKSAILRRPSNFRCSLTWPGAYRSSARFLLRLNSEVGKKVRSLKAKYVLRNP